MMQSKYLAGIAILVICYGMSINLIEVIWKGQLKLLYPNSADYIGFMGKFSEFTGYATLFMLFFVSHNVMRRFGWKTAATITPVVLAGTGVLFLAFIVFKDELGWMTVLLGSTPLMLSVLFGATQNILSKSAKYSLFDPTKEMAVACIARLKHNFLNKKLENLREELKQNELSFKDTNSMLQKISEVQMEINTIRTQK